MTSNHLLYGAISIAAFLWLSTTLTMADIALRHDNGWPIIELDGQPLTRASEGPAAWITLPDAPLTPNDAGVEAHIGSVVSTFPTGRLIDSVERFEAFPNCFRRQLSFTNTATEQRDLVGADLRVRIDAQAGAASWAAQSFVMVECAPGGPTVCVAFTSPEDRYHALHDRVGQIVTHRSEAAWRLAPGEEATIGTQYLWVVEGDLAMARVTAQDWYDAIGLTVADEGPDWLRDCILYQACAGGSVDSAFSDTGGFEPFSRQLDLIADLGCNALWLMSVLTHKDISNPRAYWNLYGTLKYDEIDPACGGEEGLTELMAALRARDFRVLTEIVPSGGFAPLAMEHSDWWTYDREGERSAIFGQGLDYSNPGWQATIERSLRWLTERWGFDGCRVDVADGYGVNWAAPHNGSHPSLSSHAGSIGMLAGIRRGMTDGGCGQPAVVPETGSENPEFVPWGQVGYGFPFISLMEEVQGLLNDPAKVRAKLADHLTSEQGSLPRGMILLRALNNHDTVVEHGRVDRRFGVAASRALMAVCTVIEGVPMVYQEQEVGSYSYLRSLLWARRAVPELGRGSADYVAIEGPPEVFAVLRSLGDTSAIGLVNLSWEPVDGSFRAAGVGPQAELYDAVSGREGRMADGRFEWTLAPYGVAILRVGVPPLGEAPPETHQPVSVPVDADEGGWGIALGGVRASVTVSGADMVHRRQEGLEWEVEAVGDVDGAGRLAIRLTGVDRWMVETERGVYEDRLLRRHYPWPEGLYFWEPTNCWGYEPHNLYNHLLPAGRVWQSAVAALPPGATLAFAGPDGTGLRIRCLDAVAQNIVLTDRSEQPDPEPYGLTLLFLATDADLSPSWTPAHSAAGWIEVPSPAADAPRGPLSVRLEISPLADFGEALDQAAPPRPPSAARRIIGPAAHSETGRRTFLIQPNTVRLENLPLTEGGDYTLWLELRHSERGPEESELGPHYTVTLDGRPLALEWARLNAWHTGNGYFGWARLDVGPLAAGVHELAMATDHTWCGIGPEVYISRDPAFAP